MYCPWESLFNQAGLLYPSPSSLIMPVLQCSDIYTQQSSLVPLEKPISLEAIFLRNV